VAGRFELAGAKNLDGVAGPDGLARFENVAAGAWTVTAVPAAQLAARREIKLAPGAAAVQVLVVAARPNKPTVTVDDARGRMVLSQQPEFGERKAELKPSAAPVLDEIADALLRGHAPKVEVQAHVEKAGRPADAKRLTDARAQAVVDALVARGVPAKTLTPAGLGYDMPIAPGVSPKAKLKNRRIEIVFGK
jgi:outer membrane protein OmpA-like peptidoglycan-associated protein